MTKMAARNRLKLWFPDDGPLCRELYVKHVQFMNAGATEHERLFIAANRVGKSETGAYEAALPLTGRYPDWWTGKRFNGPVKLWAAGESSKKVREVVQEKLFGPPNALGTGMIPADAIIEKSMKAGVPDAIDTAWIRHVSGGDSHLTLKSYEQGREGFDGDAIHCIWLDEEPELPIYTECLLRTMTTKGVVCHLHAVTGYPRCREAVPVSRTQPAEEVLRKRDLERRTAPGRRDESEILGIDSTATSARRGPKVCRTSAPA